jgi:hypothetical protein
MVYIDACIVLSALILICKPAKEVKLKAEFEPISPDLSENIV